MVLPVIGPFVYLGIRFNFCFSISVDRFAKERATLFRSQRVSCFATSASTI